MMSVTRFILAVAAATAAAQVPAVAAPMTPTEQTEVLAREAHENRDVQTGNHKPHGTLTPKASDSFAKEQGGKTNQKTAPAASQKPDVHKAY